MSIVVRIALTTIALKQCDPSPYTNTHTHTHIQTQFQSTVLKWKTTQEITRKNKTRSLHVHGATVVLLIHARYCPQPSTFTFNFRFCFSITHFFLAFFSSSPSLGSPLTWTKFGCKRPTDRPGSQAFVLFVRSLFVDRGIGSCYFPDFFLFPIS